ncbi:probable 2,3-dimethylmalate lyase at N-terminal half [Coccomyxa sp. Obi]|nr:probable 2,3-dimethylmalate lyase at N-terminal half [Coccomyxa sp. Obi]
MGPCCHDGLSARLIEEAGFPIAFMSGFGVSAARLGAPDTNLLSYSEVLDQGRNINEATRAIPIIGDGDTGYGNALNVKRTVRGFAGAGFAGILIEDQVAPKSCGHVRGKRVVGRQEALARIRAAVDAREEGADILIVARTDARQADSLQEALWRVDAFADAGADIVFIDALETREEMRAFCSSARNVPKMANMLEGGGKTPILAPAELEEMGFKLVAYPLSLLGVSIRAMQAALTDLKDGRLPPDTALPSFADIQSAVGFPQYYAEAARYAVTSTTDASTIAASQEQVSPAEGDAAIGSGENAAGDFEVAISFEDEEASTSRNADRSVSGDSAAGLSSLDEELRELALDSDTDEAAETSDKQGTSSVAEEPSVTVVEPDAIVLSERQQGGAGGEDASTALRRARFLRVKITSVASGEVRLETRLPAAFVDGIATVIPQVAGVDLEELIQQTQAGWTRDKPVADFETGGERIQIFLDGLK